MARASHAAGIKHSPWGGSALGALGAWSQTPLAWGTLREVGGISSSPQPGWGGCASVSPGAAPYRGDPTVRGYSRGSCVMD